LKGAEIVLTPKEMNNNGTLMVKKSRKGGLVETAIVIHQF
jgi:hypothetical protein